MNEPPDVALVAHGALPLPSRSHPCPYLAGRLAREEAWLVAALPAQVYHELMDRNFRRVGHVVYRPRCVDCGACLQLRVPVDQFRPSRSQRRAQARNQDVILQVGRPRCSAEKVDLYGRYLAAKHPDAGGDSGSVREFLYRSCVGSREIEYRDAAGRLLAVSIVDETPESLSSVYHFYDPRESRRSLGVFSVLAEIGLCRSRGIPWYYLGYWIEGARTMDYKARFRPHELLVDGTWRRVH